MKKTFCWLLCCALLFVFFSCDETGILPEDHLSTRTEPFGFHWAGGSGGITLYGVSNDYTASVNCDWCTVEYSGKKGDGNPTLQLVCAENPTPERREAILTISSGLETAQVLIFQNRSNPMTVSATEFDISADAAEITVSFQTYYPAHYTPGFYDETTYIESWGSPRQINPNARPQWIDLKKWDVVESEEEGNKQSITLTVRANPEDGNREGHFYLSEREGSTYPIDIIVRQTGRQ